MKKPVGVILAGGESRRFGSPKAFANFRGIPMYQHVQTVLEPFVEHLIIISHPKLFERFSNDSSLLVLQDLPPFQGKGPLAGIYSALTLVESEDFLIFPCDAPLIKKTYIEWLLIRAKERPSAPGIIPNFHSQFQPLMGYYRKSCLPFLKVLLESDQLRVRDLIESAQIPVLEVPDDVAGATFYNVNTQQHLKEI